MTRTPRILIVDDDVTTLQGLTKAVRDAGYEPVPAQTWEQAIAGLRRAEPDVVVVDVTSQSIDGYKLIRVIKTALERFVPAIQITPFADNARKRRGAEAGVDDYVTKPVTPWELGLRIETMLRVKTLTEQISDANRQLSELAITDDLTQLHNRMSLDHELEREFARSRRYEHPLSVLMLDIDFFKRVNDEHGHDVGDRALVLLAKVLREATRETDVCARYGGEEFTILAPETGAADALVVAERVRARAQEQSDAAPGIPSYTVSIGVAATDWVQVADATELVRRADQALYAAKREGRNQCVVADQSAAAAAP